ncbi:MAG: hypothetical protein VYD05_07260, partial [Planctomycetota bacterium]|nr:hypothetical protein [Planctomycetota bacterium]
MREPIPPGGQFLRHQVERRRELAQLRAAALRDIHRQIPPSDATRRLDQRLSKTLLMFLMCSRRNLQISQRKPFRSRGKHGQMKSMNRSRT